jgi:hypothetical protein
MIKPTFSLVCLLILVSPAANGCILGLLKREIDMASGFRLSKRAFSCRVDIRTGGVIESRSIRR